MVDVWYAYVYCYCRYMILLWLLYDITIATMVDNYGR